MEHIINETTTIITMIGGFIGIIIFLYRINDTFNKRFTEIKADIEKETKKIDREILKSEDNRNIVYRRFDEFKGHIRGELKYTKDD